MCALKSQRHNVKQQPKRLHNRPVPCRQITVFFCEVWWLGREHRWKERFQSAVDKTHKSCISKSHSRLQVTSNPSPTCPGSSSPIAIIKCIHKHTYKRSLKSVYFVLNPCVWITESIVGCPFHRLYHATRRWLTSGRSKIQTGA